MNYNVFNLSTEVNIRYMFKSEHVELRNKTKTKISLQYCLGQIIVSRSC